MNPVSKQSLRELRERPLIIKAFRIAFRGDRVECPCCGATFRHFRAFGGDDRVCWVCGSMERHRAVWLYLNDHPEMLRPGMSILHVAPERVLRNRLRAVPDARYVGGDLTAEFGPERIDVTSLQYADASFDAVVCNHVLEHVPDDRKAMAEICRVLRPGGWALLQVPDLEWNSLQETSESPELSDPGEQERRFGQADHVRRYGWSYVERLEEAGLDVEVTRLDEILDQSAIQRYRLEKRGHVEPIFVATPRA